MKLYTLSTGDTVYRYYKSIVVLFAAPRKVFSTSVLNGGYREDLSAVFNHDCNPGAGMACTLRAPTYEGHMRLVAEELGLDPEKTSGLGTAASMENVVVKQESYKELTVTAIVTGGVEVNGGRAGDPASYYNLEHQGSVHKPGTINILLVIDADLPPGILARALVTCTEAKTAALQELMAGSNYSAGLATGSGTDGTIVVANPGSALYFEGAGKHSKLGELIGRTVKDAVKEALFRQTKLSPEYQHSILNRMKRYGITEESLWQQYRQSGGEGVKARFLACLHEIARDEHLVTYTSLYIHLLDQYEWGLISAEEAVEVACRLGEWTAAAYRGTAPPEMKGSNQAEWLTAWTRMWINITDNKLKREEEK